MTLYECLDEFYTHKRTYIKPKSAKNYYETLHLFVDYIGKDTQIEVLKQSDLQKYQIHVNESKSLSDGTKTCYIRNLRIFIKWCNEEYSLCNISDKKIKIPKLPKKEIHLYTDNEIKQMYNLCDCSEKWITLRNRTILTVLIDTGIRRDEVRTLQKSDVDFQNRWFYVHGKGSKDRIVPFSERSEELIKQLWEICPYKECEYTFAGRYGKQLGNDAVKQFLSKLNQLLPFEVSSHRLRHNFATNYALHYLEEYGTSCAVELADIMGHEDTDTTEKYVHTAHKLISMKRRYSRIDNIRW